MSDTTKEIDHCVKGGYPYMDKMFSRFKV